MQRWSKLFIPTLRDIPADAEVASHQLLLRAGYIRQLGAGIYSYLPLGTRAINKVVAIVRQEMDTIAQEFFLPALHPREIWEESGRWTGMGDNMFRLKDRRGADLALGMTHEEVMTSIARNELRSYKQLPQIWYQIQTKFRDEPRPKSGLLRVRQFTMKDSYSFDIDAEGLDRSYDLHDAAYRRIFNRCGLEFVAVEADSGAMGGSQSQEFMVYTEAGEDWIASSPDGTYAANIEKATSTLAPVEDLPDNADNQPFLVPTPNVRTIDELSSSFRLPKAHFAKTLAFIASEQSGRETPLAVMLRGDHTLNETKLLGEMQFESVRPMTSDEIQKWFGVGPGFLGPLNIKTMSRAAFEMKRKPPKLPGGMPQVFSPMEGDVLFIYDVALRNRRNVIVGANKEDHHYTNVTVGRDFAFEPNEFLDIRAVNAGEPDPLTGQPLRLGKAVEIGHIFKLGYKYSQSMGARVLDRNGKETTPIMGSYGIGIERILTAAIEQSAARLGKNDRGEWSYALPASIAPFPVVVTVTKQSDTALATAGEQIATALEAAGIDVLLDDRADSAGTKFKDADLIGAPFRINVGKKLTEGLVELVDRLQNRTTDLPVDAVVPTLQPLLSRGTQV